MTFDENAIIRYLMGEMDPSEATLFEQKMQEDEDLLIDVESLRAVYQRISNLKPMNPPKQVSRQVLMEASHHLALKERSRQRRAWMAAAASVLVLVLGGVWATSGDPIQVSGEELSVGGVSAPAELEATTASGPLSGSVDEAGTVKAASNVSPWVDNNEELHFMDRYDQRMAGQFDSLLYQSMDRLQPLQQTAVETREPTGGLHLTGQ